MRSPWPSGTLGADLGQKRFRFPSPDDNWNNWQSAGGASSGGMSAAGVQVTPTSAMQAATVYSCIRKRSGDISTLPFCVFQRQADGGRKIADDLDVHTLIHDEPNDEMTSQQFWGAAVGHYDLRGNPYAFIDRADLTGRLKGLYPLNPDAMTVTRTRRAGKIVYQYRPTGPGEKPDDFPADRILHPRGLSSDGLVGYSTIRCGCELIGANLATTRFGAQFFKQGGYYFGAFSTDAALDEEPYKRLRDQLASRYGGQSRPLLLEGGLKFQSITMTPEDSQLLELLQLQETTICGLFGVPPHMVGRLERATFSNIAHQQVEYVGNLRPTLVAFAQEVNRKLIPKKLRREFYAEHIIEGLLRADPETRSKVYGEAMRTGRMTLNEIRAKDNLPAQKGGDQLFVEVNLMPLDKAGELGGKDSEAKPET